MGSRSHSASPEPGGLTLVDSGAWREVMVTGSDTRRGARRGLIHFLQGKPGHSVGRHLAQNCIHSWKVRRMEAQCSIIAGYE